MPRAAMHDRQPAVLCPFETLPNDATGLNSVYKPGPPGPPLRASRGLHRMPVHACCHLSQRPLLRLLQRRRRA
eukprot:4506219-Lingulodinium_polyedra.AAC.1